MIKLGDTIFYIDLNQLEKVITIKGTTNDGVVKTKQTTILSNLNEDGNKMDSESITITEHPSSAEINLPKYEIVKLMVDVIMDYTDDVESDLKLGEEKVLEAAPLSYKIAFNTLFVNGILREK